LNQSHYFIYRPRMSLTVTQLADFYPELFVFLQYTLNDMDSTFKENNNFIKCNIQHMNR